MSSRQVQAARVARYNRAVVLDLIRRLGPISKSELAENSGLAVSSVLNVVSSLSRRGLVRSVTVGPSTGGRPPALYELNPDAHYAVGVNIRISLVEAVLVDFMGSIVAETALALDRGLDVEPVVEAVIEAVDQIVRLGRVDPTRVLGVGIGCPGPVSGGRIVVGSPGLRTWRGVPLAALLEGKLGLPVALDNDSNLAALGEFRYGVASQFGSDEPIVYLYVDFGIGCGVVIDGKVYRGIDGMAGEIGHTVVDVDGPQCVCGTYGCLEAVASTSSVIRRVLMANRLGGESALAGEIGTEPPDVCYDDVVQAVEDGDTIAEAAVDEALRYLAVGIVNATRVFRPRVIVLGGEMFDRWSGAHERLKSAVKSRRTLFGVDAPPISVGHLGKRAVSVGAATLVLEQFFGVPEDVMVSEPSVDLRASALETGAHRREVANEAMLITQSNTQVSWAGELHPGYARISAGEPFTASVDVESAHGGELRDLKVVLHWDRVTMFGGNWPNPKNSSMRLVRMQSGRGRFEVTLGSLLPGKYEFAAHVLGKNDMWVRADTSADVNGRVEVVRSREPLALGEAPSSVAVEV